MNIIKTFEGSLFEYNYNEAYKKYICKLTTNNFIIKGECFNNNFSISSILTDNYIKSCFYGICEVTFRENYIVKGNFNNSSFNGICTIIYKNGTIGTGEIIDDFFKGLFTRINKKGDIQSGEVLNEKFIGNHKRINIDGSIIIGKCYNGDDISFHGEFDGDCTYTKDSIIENRRYSKGKLISLKTEIETNHIAIKCPYCPNKQMIILEDCVMFAETTNICCVCQDAKANVFLPCRHVLFCKDCALIMDGK
jgi:hypothetical protein